MVFLEALNSTFTTVTILYRLNAFNRSECTGDCSDVRYLVLQTSLADCLAVFGVVALCFWCVDYKANFLVHNHIYYIWAAGTNLVYNVALDSVCVVEVCSALSSNQCKAEVLQSFSNFENLIFLSFLVAEGNKNLLVFPGSRCVWKF